MALVTQQPWRPTSQIPPLDGIDYTSRSRLLRYLSDLLSQRARNQAPQTFQDPPDIFKRARRAKRNPDNAFITRIGDPLLRRHQLPLVPLMRVLPYPRWCRTCRDTRVGDSCDGITHASASQVDPMRFKAGKYVGIRDSRTVRVVEDDTEGTAMSPFRGVGEPDDSNEWMPCWPSEVQEFRHQPTEETFRADRNVFPQLGNVQPSQRQTELRENTVRDRPIHIRVCTVEKSKRVDCGIGDECDCPACEMTFPHLLQELIRHDEAADVWSADDLVPAYGDRVDFEMRRQVEGCRGNQSGGVEYGVPAVLLGML